MLGYFKRWCVLLGLLPMMLFAASVAAHPIDHDEQRQRSDASGHREALAETPALAEPRQLGDDGVASALPSAGSDDRRAAWPGDASRGVEQESSASLFVAERPGGDRDASLTGVEQRDPLARVLRSVLNVNRQSDAGAAASSAPRAARTDQQTGLELDENLAAAVLKMEESLAEVVREALDARIDDDGRVTFSLAGLAGFHLTSRDGAVLLGHGDTTLALTRDAGGSLERRVAELDAERSQQELPPRGANLLGELLNTVVAMLRYPLVWVVLLMLVIGKIALMIATAQTRKRSRSHRVSADSQQTKVKRSRSRYKLRSRVRLQQP